MRKNALSIKSHLLVKVCVNNEVGSCTRVSCGNSQELHAQRSLAPIPIITMEFPIHLGLVGLGSDHELGLDQGVKLFLSQSIELEGAFL